MRWIILGLLGLWALLSVVAYAVVLPDRSRGEGVVRAYFAVADEAPNPHVREVFDGFERWLAVRGLQRPEEWRSALAPGESDRWIGLFREYYDDAEGRSLGDVPRLVWSTDDNPARPIQCQLFREWHLRTYGEPVDIVTDPSNRDITKAIVQCVADAGPDVIEAYGPGQLQQVVDAGFATDVTEIARERGFAVDRVFDAAVPSIAKDGRQYAFPCNVGYTVLFYHADLFEKAGVTPPSGPWTTAELLETSNALAGAGVVEKPFVYVNFTPWDMTLSLGIDFLNEDATGSEYNRPETVAALQTYLDLVYEHKISPSPAEAASKATSGGANMNADAASASASSFFLNKDAAMVIDGRWQYVQMAERNFTVIRPAMDRRIAELESGAAERVEGEADLLASARRKLSAQVLNVLTPAERAAMEGALTDEDRSRLLRVGVAHIPTVNGVPYYKAGARMAIANRSSPHREHAVRFLEFLASEGYNEQINQSFDSICGVREFCFDEDGIAGPPEPLPGLEAFDSPVFAEAMEEYAHPERMSPFIGNSRLGMLVSPFMERLQNGTIGAAEAAAGIEQVLNAQIHANLERDAELRALWESMTGKTFDPTLPLREQLGGAGVAG